MTLKRVQLEILKDGHVIRSHHFWFDADYGDKFRLMLDKKTYTMDTDGKIKINNEDPPIEKIINDFDSYRVL